MNNDDMDEAFKKAADEYELNEELAANWKSVHEALQHNAPPPLQTVKEKKRRRFIFFWWLLIPAALLIMYGTGMFSSGYKQVDVVKQIDTDKNEETIKSQPSIAAEQNDIKNNTNKELKEEEAKSKDELNKPSELINNKTGLINNDNLRTKDDIRSSVKTKPGNVQPRVENNAENTTALSGNNNQNKLPAKQDKIDAIAGKETVTDQSKKQEDLIKSSNNNKEEAVAQNDQKKENNNSVNSSTVNPSSKKDKKKSIDNYVREAYKYAGITANADLSFIKNQKTSGPGFGAGVIAGYHFKNGVSVETGFLYDKKNYYTKGQYFSKDRLNDYLQSSEILESEGNCNMWEIPLNIRYDFSTRKSYNWFVTTGISSYLMTKEYYEFTYKFDGELRHHGYDYKNSSQDWFSVLNIGAGVNIKAGDKYLLQVQPYYKVPLKGVGIGSLSLNSTGLNVNLVRRFK